MRERRVVVGREREREAKSGKVKFVIKTINNVNFIYSSFSFLYNRPFHL